MSYPGLPQAEPDIPAVAMPLANVSVAAMLKAMSPSAGGASPIFQTSVCGREIFGIVSVTPGLAGFVETIAHNPISAFAADKEKQAHLSI